MTLTQPSVKPGKPGEPVRPDQRPPRGEADEAGGKEGGVRAVRPGPGAAALTAAGPPRLWVIGASGFVGQHLVAAAAGAFTVLTARIELTDATAFDRAFATLRPDCVVLLAAMSDIDRCEREPALAWSINVVGAQRVAEACARLNTRLVFVSTGAVFDGTRHGYRESDPPTPIGHYGRTKAEAEKWVQHHLPSAAIVRSSLVLGRARQPGTNSLLDKWVAAFAAGRTVAVPAEEYRNPIDVQTLSEGLITLAARGDAGGLFHLGARESRSRYELAGQVARALGYPPARVVPQTDPGPGRAPRGRDHWLLCADRPGLWPPPLPTCDQVIERALYGVTQSHSRVGV